MQNCTGHGNLYTDHAPLQLPLGVEWNIGCGTKMTTQRLAVNTAKETNDYREKRVKLLARRAGTIQATISGVISMGRQTDQVLECGHHIVYIKRHEINQSTLTEDELGRSDKSSRGGSGHKSDHKTTRVRTVLNEKQLHTLRTCYNANPRPDALMKEQLTEMTGLSPRVIRVWFQNKRCKDKKRSILMKQMQQQQEKVRARGGYWANGRVEGVMRLNATGQAGSDGSPSALLAASDLHTSGCLLQ
ncbi:hypothetical protein RRG08_043542 [Elysia crispata]|uniref:Homeobox domain-containing protein n=1 Tax=Elysia crispata TaxID=231223 RepID=A0AAE0YG72_9GAST|nr:hypothetical protein RRG08_043542 [Elysia crispata]